MYSSYGSNVDDNRYKEPKSNNNGKKLKNFPHVSDQSDARFMDGTELNTDLTDYGEQNTHSNDGMELNTDLTDYGEQNTHSNDGMELKADLTDYGGQNTHTNDSKVARRIRKYHRLPDVVATLKPPLSQVESDQRAAARLLADNFASCLAALLLSLNVGLALPQLSTAIASTGRSDEPLKALRRYVSTARNVIAWHLGDPLSGDPTSCPAARSADLVRRAHASAAPGGVYPPRDMRTVQTAFVAYVLLPHRQLFGIRCRGEAEQQEAQVAAYARHWHRVGLALGIAAKDSALAGDLRSCRSACGDVQLRLLAALQSPPAEFHNLAGALCGGIRIATRLPFSVASPQAMVAVFLDAADSPKAMRRRALSAVGYRPVLDAVLSALLRCVLRLLAWAPRWLHRRLFARTCEFMGLRLPEWWRLEHETEA